MNNLGLIIPQIDTSFVNAAPSAQEPSFWDKAGGFIDNVSNLFQSARPVVQQGSALYQNIRNPSTPTTTNTNLPTAPPTNNTTKIVVGVLAALVVGGGIYLATRPKKKGVNGLGCACDTVDAEAQVVSSTPLNGVKKTRAKRIAKKKK